MKIPDHVLKKYAQQTADQKLTSLDFYDVPETIRNSTLTNHEHTFGKVLETPEDLFIHIDQRLVELQVARWHDALEQMAPNDGPDREFTEAMRDKRHDFLDALSDPNTEVTLAEGGKVAKDVK